MIERWKPVLGYEGLYEVSDHGRVRSLTRQVVGRDGVARTRNGGVIKPKTDTEGRLQVSMSRDGKRGVRRVHRLVLEAFVGPRPDGLEGCHNDGNNRNNLLGNLRWDTRSSNMQDSLRHGTHGQASKSRCAAGHLYEGENVAVRVTKRGIRRDCLTCRRERSRERMRATYVPHPRPARLSDTDRARMAEMRRAGLKLREISETFAVSEATACRVLKKDAA